MIPNFRAWYDNKMWWLAKLDLWGDPDQTICELAPYLPKYEELYDIYLSDVILMQSTGLKDKKGVEIYEGDIVRHSKISTDISIVRFGEFGVPNIEEMEYQDMAVGFYFENASDLKDVEPFNMTIPLNNLYVEGIEIIGNIYENPELLEESE